MGAVLLGKHTLGIRFLVYNPKQVHCTVANIAEHIDTLKITKVFGNSSEPLRIDFCTDNFNAVIGVTERKFNIAVLKQIFLKLSLLLTYPS